MPAGRNHVGLENHMWRCKICATSMDPRLLPLRVRRLLYWKQLAQTSKEGLVSMFFKADQFSTIQRACGFAARCRRRFGAPASCFCDWIGRCVQEHRPWPHLQRVLFMSFYGVGFTSRYGHGVSRNQVMGLLAGSHCGVLSAFNPSCVLHQQFWQDGQVIIQHAHLLELRDIIFHVNQGHQINKQCCMILWSYFRGWSLRFFLVKTRAICQVVPGLRRGGSFETRTWL